METLQDDTLLLDFGQVESLEDDVLGSELFGETGIL